MHFTKTKLDRGGPVPPEEPRHYDVYLQRFTPKKSPFASPEAMLARWANTTVTVAVKQKEQMMQVCPGAGGVRRTGGGGLVGAPAM